MAESYEIYYNSYFEFEAKESPYQLLFHPGKYLITLIAASGGYTYSLLQVNPPGKGGLVKGTINIYHYQELYLYVGSQGKNSTKADGGLDGYNGGGNGYKRTSEQHYAIKILDLEEEILVI